MCMEKSLSHIAQVLRIHLWLFDVETTDTLNVPSILRYPDDLCELWENQNSAAHSDFLIDYLAPMLHFDIGTRGCNEFEAQSKNRYINLMLDLVSNKHKQESSLATWKYL